MSATSTLDADGVKMYYATLSGGTTYALSTKNPNTEAAVSLDEGGTATAHTGSTSHIQYWIYNGGNVTYESGGTGKTARVTLKPSGPGPQTFNWKNGAIDHGFILNDQDISDGEFTVYVRPHTDLGVHHECSLKVKGGIHTGTDDPSSSCVEMRYPMAGASPQAAREYDHPDYDFITLEPKFTSNFTENVFVGLKYIFFNNDDGHSATNRLYIDPTPFDSTGKPANNWQLYSEWTDDSNTDTGRYAQACLWKGWLFTLRVDGFDFIDFCLPSIREIDKNAPLDSSAGPCGGMTCPTGQHLNTTTCVCEADPVTCPSGQVFSTEFNKCIPTCVAGQHYDNTQDKCIDDVTTPPGVTCDAGQHYDPDLAKCVPDPTGKIGDNAFAFYYSGGLDVQEATAGRSTGGFISNVQIHNADLNNLFSSINGPDMQVPQTEYRCIYVKNISDQTAYSTKLYFFSPKKTQHTGTLSPDTRIRGGLGAAGKNKIEPLLQNPTSPPFGVCIASYYNPDNAYIWLGKVFPHDVVPIWVERRHIAGLRAWGRDQTLLLVEYDETAKDPIDIPNLCAAGFNDIPCPDGQSFDYALNKCVTTPTTTPPCDPGFHKDINGNCVPDDTGPPPCPSGEHFDSGLGQCVPDTPPPGVTCPPGSHYDSATQKCIEDSVDPCAQTASLSVAPDSTAQIYAPITVVAPDVEDTSLLNDPGPIGTATSQGITGTQIYKAKAGGKIYSTMNDTGGQCQSDGIRFNFEYDDCHVYDRECTWSITVTRDCSSCTDKPWWSPKIGAHDDSQSTLVECSFNYDGSFKSIRTESPHGSYNNCSGGHHASTIPTLPLNKVLGFKTAVYRTTHSSVMFEWWVDFNSGTLAGPWTKLGWIDWGGDGSCSAKNGNGLSSGCWPGDPSGGLQDTWRANGCTATFHSGQIIEIMQGGVLNDGSNPPPNGCTGTCPTGQHFDSNCVCQPDSPPPGTTCDPGFHDDGTGHCVPDTPPPPTGCTGTCPDQQHFDSNCNCVPDNPPPVDTGSSPFTLDTTNYLASGPNNRLRGEPTSQTITDHNSVNLTQDLALGIMTDTQYSPSKIATYNQNTLTTQHYMMDQRDWRNTEFTLYIEAIAFNTDAFIELQLRGGVHTSTAGQTCESTGYRARIYANGKTQLRKQLDFNAESDANNDPVQAMALTQVMKDKFYVGIKFIVYDETRSNNTVCRVLIDDSTDNMSVLGNHWRQVLLFKDTGTNWPVLGTNPCGGTTTTRIVWGGPLANIVTSGFTNYDLKKIAVTEITPPC